MLERLAKMYRSPGFALRDQEREILNQFKRQAHHYIPAPPSSEEDLEWLSLIRHHGGPTRLLDLTGSFYVAAFFAVEKATEEAAVWAVNRKLLDRRLTEGTELTETGIFRIERIRAAAREAAERSLDGADALGVVAVKPWRLSQRMALQQGWFLCPMSLSSTFEHNLCAAFGIHGETLPGKTPSPSAEVLRAQVQGDRHRICLVKFCFPCRLHDEMLRDLRRMNITAATLFPGLDGFARSLRFSLRYLEEVFPCSDEDE